MKPHQRMEDDEFAAAALEEKRRRHDVMAHVHTQVLEDCTIRGVVHKNVDFRGVWECQ